MCRGIFDPGIRPYRARVALALFWSHSHPAIGQWSWGFNTVRGGIIPADHIFGSRDVGVIEMRRDFRAGEGSFRPRIRRDWGGTRGFLRGATPSARAAALHWPGAGASSTNGLRAWRMLRWKLSVILLLIYYKALRSAGCFHSLC